MEVAAAEQDFNVLRHDLMSFLRWRGTIIAEDIAQEALLRILKKIKEGEQIANLQAYGRRVAELVYLEDVRRRRQETGLVDAYSVQANHDVELLAQCVEECKKKCLTLREAKFIERYYASDARQRKLLAKSRNMTAGQLRRHAMEIRNKLRTCVEDCLAKSQP